MTVYDDQRWTRVFNSTLLQLEERSLYHLYIVLTTAVVRTLSSSLQLPRSIANSESDSFAISMAGPTSDFTSGLWRITKHYRRRCTEEAAVDGCFVFFYISQVREL